MLPFEYEEVEEDGHVTSYGGLPIVAEVMRNFGASNAVTQHVELPAREHDAAWCVESLAMLLAAGGDCIDDMNLFLDDSALARLLQRTFPSPETLRRFLYAFHDDELVEAGRKQAELKGATSFVPEESDRLKGLQLAQEALVHGVAGRGRGKVATLDVDASIHESHKREAQPHYKKGRGYQPTIAVWAELDLVVADEFRDGNVPAGKDTLRLVERAFSALPEQVTRRRLRADSALYNLKTLRWLYDHGIEYTISADMSRPLREACVGLPQTSWKRIESRAHEHVHVAEVDWCPSDWANSRERPRYLAVRYSPRQGSLLEESGPKYLAVVTHRKGEPEELLRWHWEKAGTVEHVHDVIKHELGAGTLPCGRFGANAAWYRIALLTYNALSALRSVAMPPSLQDARPKRLRFHVFVQPAEVINHARRLIARVRKKLRCLVSLPALRLAIAT